MRVLLLPILGLLMLLSCTRKEIEFGTVPENAYTELTYIDTVSAQLSTTLLDSFTTTGDTSFLIGRYHDPFLGTVTTKAFLQLAVPATVPEIASSAVFDSLELIIKPNHYYYGDTSKIQTVIVNELAEQIVHTYNNQLFNTSNFTVKAAPLGSRRMRIRPSVDDSISIRLDNARGIELFSKLRQKTSEVTVQTDFINYFYGLSLSVPDSETSAVFGLKGTDTSVVMRVHYHNTIPFPESQFIDFISLANEYAFTQVLPDRASTGLVPITPGLSELFPATTNGRAYLQPGTGLTLKMTFPTLKSILNRENNGLVKLIKAEILVKPEYLSFDLYKYKLPAALGLAQTDASNLAGSAVNDPTGQGELSVAPVIDEIYGINNYYRFDVTSYINQWLVTVGTEKNGFFLLQRSSISRGMDRLVLDAVSKKDAGVMLLLQVLNVNN